MNAQTSALLAGTGYGLMGIGMVLTLGAMCLSREHAAQQEPGTDPAPAPRSYAVALVVGPLLAAVGVVLFVLAMP